MSTPRMSAKARAKLRELLGPGFLWRTKANAPADDAERAAAKAEAKKAVAKAEAAKGAMEAIRRELLADPRFVEAKAAWQLAETRKQHVYGRSLSYRVTVGRSNGMFFTAEAEGDSFADVIAKLESKRNGGDA